MEIPASLEKWSWIAGILSAAIAIIAFIWQVVAAKLNSARNTDWQVMDKALNGIRIGTSIQSAQKLNLKPLARNGFGTMKITKWQCENGNEISVTYDSKDDRILYAEVDWNYKESSTESGIEGVAFGKTTLEDIREKYGSNGFSFADHMMFKLPEGLVTFNAFELKNTPTIIVVFITRIATLSNNGSALPVDESELISKVASLFKLVSIAIADESYLDSIWGKQKIYDPKSLPIKLSIA
ncbi:MAG: hypothetical protein ACLP9S_05810 [Syntrophales bacterium]